MALPVYTMNCFKLPKGICDEITSILQHYWWTKGTGSRSMHWLSWNRMGFPKCEGGLGFRDIEKFNVAILGKQAWRFLQTPHSLLSRLLRGRYFEYTNILNADLGSKPSYV